MATAQLYNLQGKAVGEVKLDDKVFGVAVNKVLVHEAAVIQQNNARASIAHTKTRGEVRGGGKKPWKQKGTGRARHGSTRSPIWVGGGVTFGPRKDRSFDLKMNRRARRKAICMVLSDRVADQHFVALESLMIEGGKTKILASGLKQLPSNGRSVLLVVDPKNMEARRAAQNIPKVTTIAPNSLNVVDLLRYPYILAGKEEIEKITETYSS